MRGVCAETMAFAHDGWDEAGTRGNGRREEWREGRHQRILKPGRAVDGHAPRGGT